MEPQILQSLDGRVRWRWPSIWRQWAKESRCPVVVTAEPDGAVRLIGHWGRVRGVLLVRFESQELAEKAAKEVRRAIKYG